MKYEHVCEMFGLAPDHTPPPTPRTYQPPRTALPEEALTWLDDRYVHGMYNMCVALLEGAYNDLKRDVTYTDADLAQIPMCERIEGRLLAIDWIWDYQPDPKNLFSFAQVCSLMGVDEDDVRRALSRFLTDEERTHWYE